MVVEFNRQSFFAQGGQVFENIIKQRNNVWEDKIPAPYNKASIVALNSKDDVFGKVASRLLEWSKTNKRCIYIGGDEQSGKTYVGYAFLRRLFLKQVFNLDELCVIPMSSVVSACEGGFSAYKTLLDDYTGSGRRVFFVQGFYSHNSTTNAFFTELFDKASLQGWVIVVTGVPYSSVASNGNIGKSLNTLFKDSNLSLFVGEYMRRLSVKN